MPKAGYCEVCKKNVWLKEDGSCENGHPKNVIKGAYEVVSTPQETELKEAATLLPRWRMPLIAIAVVMTILIAGGGIGVYQYFSSEARQARVRKAKVRKANVEFHKMFFKFFDNIAWLTNTGKISELEEQYDKLRVQRNEAGYNDNHGEVFRLTHDIGTILDKQEELYDERLEEIYDRGATVSDLHGKASKLSGEKKRRIALNVAAKARELNSLEEEYDSLCRDGLLVERRINESYIASARGQIPVSRFNEDMAKCNSDTEQNGKALSEKENQISKKENEVYDEWKKLESLLDLSGEKPSALGKALLGHWKTEDNTHYYIGKDKLVMVDEGEKSSMKYAILEQNKKENQITIKVTTEYGEGHIKTLTFSSDRKSLEEEIEAEGVTTKWKYVDNKQRP